MTRLLCPLYQAVLFPSDSQPGLAQLVNYSSGLATYLCTLALSPCGPSSLSAQCTLTAGVSRRAHLFGVFWGFQDCRSKSCWVSWCHQSLLPGASRDHARPGGRRWQEQIHPPGSHQLMTPTHGKVHKVCKMWGLLFVGLLCIWEWAFPRVIFSWLESSFCNTSK